VGSGSRRKSEPISDRVYVFEADNPEGSILYPTFELITCCSVPTVIGIMIELPLDLR
jgi:hypothetical protein